MDLKNTKRFARGQTLMMQDDSDTDVFFVQSGSARLALHSDNGDAISYRDVKSGDYFGWLAALDGGKRLTSAIALEDCEVATVSAQDFRQALHSDGALHDAFLRRVAETVRNYTQRIEALTILSARERILRELERRLNGKDGIDIGSHEDLASYCGTTRETVTRVLGLLESEGLIRRSGSAYYGVGPSA